MSLRYVRLKKDPLTEEEIKEKYKEIQEEMKEVLAWKKEVEKDLKDVKASPQKRGATKRTWKRVLRRIDTVNGQIIYWKLRVNGESHFKAGIEMNEYWASCRERND
ncbi:MAG: hypothetical protein ABH811_01520 [archaeon]